MRQRRTRYAMLRATSRLNVSGKCRDGSKESQERNPGRVTTLQMSAPPPSGAVAYCLVLTAMTPPMFPMPYFVVASHDLYIRIRVICDAGIVRSELMGPYA